MNKVRLGILGCGAIAPAYLQNFRQHFGEIVEVVACAETGRGLGTAEMAVAPRENRAPRSSGERTYHILKTRLAMQEGGGRENESRVNRPAPFDLDSLRLPVGCH